MGVEVCEDVDDGFAAAMSVHQAVVQSAPSSSSSKTVLLSVALPPLWSACSSSGHWPSLHTDAALDTKQSPSKKCNREMVTCVARTQRSAYVAAAKLRGSRTLSKAGSLWKQNSFRR